MQVARTSQRCMRSSALPRLFSSCAVSSKAAASSSTASTSENSQQFTTRPRFFDSLSKRSSPKARHYDMGENNSLRLTVRPPSSPAPFSQPAVSSTPSSSSAVTSDSQLPPALHKATPEYATLTPEQIAEMQALRLSDPVTWTRSKLAAKYNVSKFFVAMKSFGVSYEAKETAKSVKETHDENAKREREGWGFKKRVDREVRRRRKEFW